MRARKSEQTEMCSGEEQSGVRMFCRAFKALGRGSTEYLPFGEAVFILGSFLPFKAFSSPSESIVLVPQAILLALLCRGNNRKPALN